MKPNSTKRRLVWSELKVGIFLTFITFLMVFSIFFSGLIGKIFQEKLPLTISAENIGGLRPGAPVRFKGFEVGSVRDIDISSKGETIQILVDKKYENLLFHNASAEIKTIGLLGSMYVEIFPGSKDSGLLKSNQTIKGTLTDPLTILGKDLPRTLNTFSKLMDQIDNGQGSAGAIIHDSAMASDLKAATSNLNKLLEDMRKNPKKYFNIKVL